MGLYSKEQLDYERSIGLQMTDEENENFYNNDEANTFNWTNQQFEEFLNTKNWREDVKNNHRNEFKGKIIITDDSICYP